MNAYKHGVSVVETPTSVSSPVETVSGVPVVLGTAPIHLANTREYVNKPFLAKTYQEAVNALGYSNDWDSYTLCEAMKAAFALYGVSPIVFINILDPIKHKADVTDSVVNITNGVAKITQDGVLLESLAVKLTSAGQPLAKNTDYVAGFDEDGNVLITPISGGAIAGAQATLTVSYTHLDTSAVTSADVIGGIDGVTGVVTGMEVVNRVFPSFGIVPGQLLAPGWSQEPTVATVMKLKVGNINGLFKAIAVCDADTTDVDRYSDVPAWKSTQKYSDPLQVVCWPKVKTGDEIYHLSTHLACVASKTDSQNGDIPYVSPSNKPLQVESMLTSSGTEVVLGPQEANFLNGSGIVTALNFASEWKVWGNRTAAFPDKQDVKDAFIPVRRMFNYVHNLLILNFWKQVDDPTSKRLIDTVVDDMNIRLNALQARGAILGGRVEFRKEENTAADLINGKVVFRLFITPPTPAENIEFKMEFDVNYLNALGA